MVRQFKLSNGTTEWDITSQETFATNPAGLGFGTEASYVRVGNDNVLTYSQYSMLEKSFDILFMGNTLEEIYQRYTNFINFILSEEIYLIYKIPSSSTEYRMKVYISSLGKGEVSADNSALTCPITMQPLSFWEDNVERMATITSPDTSVTINSVGTLDTPLYIEVVSSSTNPSYTQTYNGQVIGAGRFVGTFSRVMVNSDEASEYIRLRNSGGDIANPYNYQDLTLDAPQITFLKLKKGANVITFSSDGTYSGTVQLKYRNRYLSV